MTRRLSENSLESRLRAACRDLQDAFASGSETRAEEYFARDPDLESDEEAALELIYAEVVAREGVGHAIDPKDYFARFPRFAARLRKLFDIDDLMREAPPATNPLGRTTGGGFAGQAAGPTPRRVGPYDLLDPLGRGGMGTVWKARQANVGRFVALKLLLADGASDESVERLRREARLIGSLNHPGVVRVFDVADYDGDGPDGPGTRRLPYLVLEYAEGGSLDRFLAKGVFSARVATKVVLLVARAVAAAHRAGIVHRDLKPANVLLVAGADPELADTPLAPWTLRVTDFGLARAEGESRLTSADRAVGTCCYMAPEQAAASDGAAATAVDVWALGTLLYELLAGRPPFLADSPAETLRRLATEDAPPLRKLAHVPRDLETICLKCLRRDPGRRYESADAVADDLGRFLAGEPIRARREPALVRAWRAARRRPWVTSAALLGTMALAAVLLTWAAFTGQLADERDKAKSSESKAVKARVAAEDAALTARRLLSSVQLFRARSAFDADPVSALNMLDDEEFCPPELRDTSWRFARRVAAGLVVVPPGHDAHMLATAWSSDGRVLVTLDQNGTFCVRDGAGTLRRTMKLPMRFARDLSLDATGATAALSDRKRVIVIDTATGNTIRDRTFQVAHDVALSPDGKTAAVAGHLFLRTWTPAADAISTGVKMADSAKRLAWSADGRTLVGWAGKDLVSWNPADFAERARVSCGVANVVSLSLSADGRVALAAGQDKPVALWDVPANKVRLVDNPSPYARVVTLSAGGATAASSDRSGAVVWNVATGETIRSVGGSGLGVRCLALSPDASVVAVGGLKLQPLRLYRLGPAGRRVLGRYSSKAIALAANRAAAVCIDGPDCLLRVWDLPSGKEHPPRRHVGHINCVALSADGNVAWTAGLDKTVRRWDLRAGTVATITRAEPVFGLAVSPDGATLIARAGGGVLVTLDATSGAELASVPDAGQGNGVEIGADGTVAVVGKGGLRLLRGPERLHDGRKYDLSDAAFVGDGRTLAGTTMPGQLRLLSMDDDEAVDVPGATDLGKVARWGDDSLIAAGNDGRLRVWNLTLRREQPPLGSHAGRIMALATCGEAVLSSGAGKGGGEIVLWGAE